MSRTYTANGLVIREHKMGEADKLLTLLTPEYGQIRVMCKGASSFKNRSMAATQPFSWCNFEIYKKDDYNWLRQAELLDSFFDLRADLAALALGAYICEVMCDVTPEMQPAADLTRLTLNTLHAVSKQLRPNAQVKGVFELRLAGYIGFMPDLARCCKCGEEHPQPAGAGHPHAAFIDVMNGRLVCRECNARKAAGAVRPVPVGGDDDRREERIVIVPVTPGVLEAMRFALRALPERMFSFTLDGGELRGFAAACETYLLNHLERGFNTLDFYKTVME